MSNQKVDFDAVSQEVVEVIHRHGLTPNTVGLLINVPREEFVALAQQYPDYVHPHHHPGIIIIRDKKEWFVQIQPILKPEEYPTGEILKPSPKHSSNCLPGRRPT